MKVYGGDDNEEAETVVVVATRQRMEGRFATKAEMRTVLCFL